MAASLDNDSDIVELREVMTEVQGLLQQSEEANSRIAGAQQMQQNLLESLSQLVAQIAKRIESDENLSRRDLHLDRDLATPGRIRAACAEELRKRALPMTTPDLLIALRHGSITVAGVKDVYNALNTDGGFRRIGEGRKGKWWLAGVELPPGRH